ncbi:DUF349 domain-containing protein [Ancylomarina euxinus]|uniref:DUF349 domain-containing protein n=1 Tax=Ancylomarina euxinus TaxID=2283627 RepID=A0A425Y7C3_9BACT|nr:DUF349 domain-containing protein [Ancylomarina euxinus]MCZ4693874.1 DUF349 domain-containing protein [Ancylomarina euxinus]MUP14706.1 DUF349 domain-containing protein [Ancylomarina euxinus]RRG24250.1 DUF349 domain-containing protein [Ancylomarina euxinus]
MKEQDLTPSHENETEPIVELRAEATHDQSEEQIQEEKSDSDSNTDNLKSKTELQEIPDYASMEKHELIQRLKLILESDLDNESKERAESIKVHFYKKHNASIEEYKRVFIKEGGLEEDFHPERDDQEIEIKDLLQQYRDKKAVVQKSFEQQKENNLKQKLLIIDEIKQLISGQESFEKTFHEFRALQKKWKDYGMVPSQSIKHLWENYHHAVEQFYDYSKINRDLRDLDLRKNYEAKIALCENAEKLIEQDSPVKAFNDLQKLHEMWREVGPVDRSLREELWQRFKTISNTINKNQQNFYNGVREEQIYNLQKKTTLCVKVEEIAGKVVKTHQEWNEASKEVLEIQTEWRTIGFAPKKDNNLIYQRFREACDLFFNHKRDFYVEHKDALNENLNIKMALCEKAEELQNSTDWKQTTNELIRIQKKWKSIGNVPRKVSNEIWDRFRKACDHFFERKSEHFGSLDLKQAENLKLKEAIIEKIKEFKLSEDNEENLNTIKQFQKDWSSIGHVPFKNKENIQNDFSKAVNILYDKMNMDSSNLEIQKFKLKIDSILEGKKPEDKLIHERNKLYTRVKQLETDIALWGNNMGFFSLSDKSSSILKEMEEKISQGKKNLGLLKQKIKLIDDLAN